MLKNFFAYGTIMGPEAMRRLCPTAEYVGTHSIKGRLGFNQSGLPTWIQCDFLKLWGTRWKVSDADITILDQHETANYRKAKVGKGVEEVFFYVANDPIECDPQPEVLEGIIRDAEQLGFSVEYVERLRRLRTPRMRFIESWYGRGLSSKNPFDSFVFLYIALTVLAKAEMGGPANEEGEGRLVVKLLTSNPIKTRIIEATKKEPTASAINRLLARQKNRGGDSVLINQRTDRDFKLEPVPTVESLGWLFVNTRNNLFHGAKCYTDKDDLELMRDVTPILAATLGIIIESLEPGIVQ